MDYVWVMTNISTVVRPRKAKSFPACFSPVPRKSQSVSKYRIGKKKKKYQREEQWKGYMNRLVRHDDRSGRG